MDIIRGSILQNVRILTNHYYYVIRYLVQNVVK